MSALLAAVVGIGVWSGLAPAEPRFGGRRITEEFGPRSDVEGWIPNDVYGHVHDELWAELIAPPAERGKEQPWRVWPETNRMPVPGPEALPWFVGWMRVKNGVLDRVVEPVASRLPDWARNRLYPYRNFGWQDRAQQWHIAAFRGLSLMGTNAEPALPELAALLARDDGDLPLTWAIACIGPRGVGVLAKELSSGDPRRRDNAALALGLLYRDGAGAMPALVECVERGEASYQVFGAIGRIGDAGPRLAPALVRWLQQTNPPPPQALGTDMGILLVGLQGSAARDAAPVLVQRYHALPEGAEADRLLLRRVLRAVSPEDAARLPAPSPRETGDQWP